MNTAIPAPRAATRALVVLTAINLLNYLDRYLVPPLASDLKGAMTLSDEQLGWLWPAFMLVYMLTAPVFGAWGDEQVLNLCQRDPFLICVLRQPGLL